MKNELKSQNLDRQNPDTDYNTDFYGDFDAFGNQNPDFINRQNPDAGYYDDIDGFDLKNPDFDRKRQLSRSMNDDVCYYLKPPSTALLNVKVSQRLFKVWIFQEVIYHECTSCQLRTFVISTMQKETKLISYSYSLSAHKCN